MVSSGSDAIWMSRFQRQLWAGFLAPL